MTLPTVAEFENGQENLDALEAIVSGSETVTTPSGTEHDSLTQHLAAIDDAATEQREEIESEADDVIASIGYTPIDGDFASGATLSTRNDVLLYSTDGYYYKWAGTLPKVVAAGATPSDDGIGEGLWSVVDGGVYYEQLESDIAQLQAAAGIGRLRIMYTALGQATWMYEIPAFNIEDVLGHEDLGTGLHPAFQKDGETIPAIYIGAYPAIISNGEAVCLPGQDSKVGTDYDASKSYCEANGDGWHLMNIWEWAAVALLCLANDNEPRGNTYYGASHENAWETGIRYDGADPGDTSGSAQIKTGSGPAAWNHNGEALGIADLVGNTWEWQDGLYIDDGHVYMMPDNQPTLGEDNWSAQDLWFSSSNDSASGTTQLVTDKDDFVTNGDLGSDDYDLYDGCTFTDIEVTGTAPTLTQLALIAPGAASPAGHCFSRSYGTRFQQRGGSWQYGSWSGLGAQRVIHLRSHADGDIGFRPAYFALES
jgi:hypothetical protein